MFDIFERWLRLGAARLHDAAADLTALDQAIGDGDHGINMDRGFTAIVAQLDAGRPDADGDRALTGTAAKAAGRTLISTVGGAAGPLYGTAFIRGGASILTAEEDRSPSSVVVAAIEAAITGIAGLGKATIGEKTMLDALVPAHAAGLAQAGGWRHRSRRAGHGRRGRGRCGRHGPDARDQGSCVVPRRAEHRPPGPRRYVRRAAHARPGRCRRRELTDGSGADARDEDRPERTHRFARCRGRPDPACRGAGRAARDRRTGRAAERRTGSAIGGARGCGR